MKLEDFINDIPLLHTWDGGITYNSGGFTGQELQAMNEFIDINLDGNSTAIETGLGNSTLIFILSKITKVISICPELGLINRFNKYRYNNFTESDNSKHILYSDISSKILPVISNAEVNLALIDGSHSMPDVFIDFYYLNKMLKKGGFLLIDDTNLKSIEPLDQLVSKQKNEYIFITIIRDCKIYKKISDNQTFPEWNLCEHTK